MSNVSTTTARVYSFKPISRPSWISLRVRAWLAVRAGMRLPEFLAGRKAFYELGSAPDLAQLPQRIDVSTGHVLVQENPDFVSGGFAPTFEEFPVYVPDLRTRRSRPQSASTAEQAQRRIHEAHASLADAERVHANLAAAPAHDAPSTFIDRHPEKPPVGKLLLCVASLIAACLVEAFQFALPYLDLVGVDTRDLVRESQRAPVLVFMGLAFAAIAMAGLTHAADVVGATLRAAARSALTRRHAVWATASVAGHVALLASATWCIAAMRHGTADATAALAAALGSSSVSSSGWVFLLVACLFILLVEWLGHLVREELAARTAVRLARTAWDSLHLRESHAAARVAFLKAELASKLADAERSVAEARSRYEGLVAMECAAEEALAGEVLRDERYARAFATALASALELERAAFVREARRRGHLCLPADAAGGRALPATSYESADEASGLHQLG